MNPLFEWFLFLPRKTVLGTIRFYQRVFSPDHGWTKIFYPYGYCRYQPTCSEYTYRAVERFGITKGLLLGGWRILRCNPWSKGGRDEVPEKK